MAMLLDFKIRHETQNKKSLNDVMRALYYTIYKKENRGYTEDEFRKLCEQTAGTSLEEFFSYIYTVKRPDYAKYLNYAGLTIDASLKPTDGAWHGIKASLVKDSVRVRDVDWNSPAWKEGIRRNQVITIINGKAASMDLLNQIAKEYKAGDRITINNTPLILGTKKDATFEIKRQTSPNALQTTIAKSWLKEE